MSSPLISTSSLSLPFGERMSMSGSPKTVKRFPAPVFFSSSSPIERSAFMRGKMMVRFGFLVHVRVERHSADHKQVKYPYSLFCGVLKKSGANRPVLRTYADTDTLYAAILRVVTLRVYPGSRVRF